MRKFIITMLMCAGVGLTMWAAQPSDVVTSRQDGPVGTVSAPAGEAVGVSLQQFMRQHGVTPGDNRMAKRLQLNSTSELVGTRIASTDVYAVNPEDGTVAETSKHQGWIANLIAGDSDDRVVVEDFFTFDIAAAADSAGHPEDIFFNSDGIIPVGLPIQLDMANGVALLRSDEPIFHSEVIEVDPGNDKYKHKKVTDVFIVPLDDLSPGDLITGSLYGDGSIKIEGGFMLTTCLAYKSWKGSMVEQDYYNYEIDTVYVDSPVYRDLYLLVPNGIHEYKKASRLNGSNLTNRLSTHLDLLRVQIGDLSDPLGFGGKKPVKPGSGSSGDWNSFIPPGGGSGSLFSSNPGNDPELSLNYNLGSTLTFTDPTSLTGTDLRKRLRGSFIDDLVIGGGYDPSGFGGKKPVKPGQGSGDTMGFDLPGNSGFDLFSSGLPGNSGLSLNSVRNGNDEEPMVMQQPVYMYQHGDTIYVCNLYGHLMMDNYMVLHDDGTMSFPKQVIGNLKISYATGVEAVYPLYNYTASTTNALWNTMTPGCSGNVTADGIITWGITAPYAENAFMRQRVHHCYTDNKLYFTSVNEEYNITAVTRKINEVMNGKGSITDVTTLVNRSLNHR
ncbi:MAG: hypothetical protein IJG42_08660 [Muribaculaceae bacterium]|nr:hypothetical protein [Muribaculaceae bacterium]